MDKVQLLGVMHSMVVEEVVQEQREVLQGPLTLAKGVMEYQV